MSETVSLIVIHGPPTACCPISSTVGSEVGPAAELWVFCVSAGRSPAHAEAWFRGGLSP